MAARTMSALAVGGAERRSDRPPLRPSVPRSIRRWSSLVAAAVAGDRRAREQLLAEIHPLVLRYCRGRLGRQETVIGSADDVAQEICLAVVNALGSYTVKGLSFRAFVYGIAAHKVTDAFRAIGRNRTEPMAELPDAPTPQDDPEQQALAGELGAAPRRPAAPAHPAPARGADPAGRGRAERGGDGAGRGLDAGRGPGHPAPGAEPAARRGRARTTSWTTTWTATSTPDRCVD